MLAMSSHEELLFRDVKVKGGGGGSYEDSQEIIPKCIYSLEDSITFSKEKHIEQTSGLLLDNRKLSLNLYSLPSV